MAAGRPGRLPRRGAAAGHLRRRRVQRLAEPGLEGRARRTGGRDGPADHRVRQPAGTPTPARGGCWSPATPAGPTAGGTGAGRPGSPNWRPRRACRSPCATSRPAPPSGTRSSTGCSPRSPWAGGACSLTSYVASSSSDISAVTDRTGLTVTAVLDDTLPCRDPGQRPADQRHRERLYIRRHQFHGMSGNPRPPLSPGPPRSQHRPVPALGRQPRPAVHPALTGLDPAYLTALAAALHILFRARREQRRYLRQGHARQRAERLTAGQPQIELHRPRPFRACATPQPARPPPRHPARRRQDHHGHATTLTAALLAAFQPVPFAAPPPGIRLRGPWLPCATTPPTTASPSPASRPRRMMTLNGPPPPQTHLNLERLHSRPPGTSSLARTSMCRWNLSWLRNVINAVNGTAMTKISAPEQFDVL